MRVAVKQHDSRPGDHLGQGITGHAAIIAAIADHVAEEVGRRERTLAELAAAELVGSTPGVPARGSADPPP